jgi:N-ethylmaleimide reductase
MTEYYRQRSGAGLIFSEATVISQQGIGWVDSPGIYTEDQVEGWKNITSAVHEAKGKIFLQLWHCGRASHSDFHDGNPAVAASAVKIEGDEIHTPLGKKEHEVPKSLSIEEIQQVLDDYEVASQRARQAGFDGVEIHSANGYLLDTFLQSKTNLRTDDYGGSLSKRCKMLSDVIDRVSSVWDADSISVRLSPNGCFNDMGSDDFREQFLAVTEMIEQKKSVGILHVMDGLGFGFHEKGDPMLLSEFRKAFSGVLIGNCGYDRDSAEKQVESGVADMIAFGRPYISNPDLAERFEQGWPLNPDASTEDWYLGSEGSKGYTDFPYYQK